MNGNAASPRSWLTLALQIVNRSIERRRWHGTPPPALIAERSKLRAQLAKLPKEGKE